MLNTQLSVSHSLATLDILQNKEKTWWPKQNKIIFLDAKPLGLRIWSCWKCSRTAVMVQNQKKSKTAKLWINRKTGPLQSDGKVLSSAEVAKTFGRWCLVTAAPSNHNGKFKYYRWLVGNTEHSISLRPVQGGWRRISIQGPPNFSSLW